MGKEEKIIIKKVVKNMKETKSVKKNFIYSTFYQILMIITPLITAPYLSRVLGADGIGIQSYTNSIQTYFILLATLGTASYGAREISRNRDNKGAYTKLFWEIELLTVITTSICILFWGILICFSTKYKIIYLVMTFNLFATMFDISWFFSGLEEFKFIVLRNTFFKLLGIVLMLCLVKSRNDLIKYIFILASTNMVSSLSTWSYLPRVLVKVDFHKLNVFKHLKETLVYFIPTIATSVYTVLDKTLIQVITKNELHNGYYAQAENVINLAKSVVFTAINSVVGVRISYLFTEKKIDEIKSRIDNSLNYIFFMGMGCIGGIIGVAKTFVPTMFGKGYGPVVYLLYIFSPIILIIGISNCLGSQYYTPAGKRAQSSCYLIIGSAVNLVLNLVLIPRYASFGAAIASIMAESLITILYVNNCDGFTCWKKMWEIGYKKIISGFLMSIVLFLLYNFIKCNAIIVLGIQIIVGVFVYGIFLLLLRDKWTMSFVIHFLNKLNKNNKI